MTAPSHSLTLGLLTKYWEVGQVKSRLGKDIGMARAASLHRSFVLHLCHSLASIHARRVVCLAPQSARDPLRETLCSQGLERAWEVMLQTEGSLGDRMGGWLDAVFCDPSQPTSCAILIGADCPTVTVRQIEEARRKLESHDVVIGPAADGGYYLIGVSAPWSHDRCRTLFAEIPWSTDQVYPLTRSRIAEAGMSCSELETQGDVDTLDDLYRLREELAARTADRTPGDPRDVWRQLRITIDSIVQANSGTTDHTDYDP